VRVTFLARAGDLVGEDKRVVTLELKDSGTLEDLVKAIGENVSRRLAEGILNKRLIFLILVNDVPVHDFKYKLRDGDSVVFTTPEMGG
jgi:molybdopterin converting factor small subunit